MTPGLGAATIAFSYGWEFYARPGEGVSDSVIYSNGLDLTYEYDYCIRNNVISVELNKDTGTVDTYGRGTAAKTYNLPTVTSTYEEDGTYSCEYDVYFDVDRLSNEEEHYQLFTFDPVAWTITIDVTETDMSISGDYVFALKIFPVGADWRMVQES